MPDLDTVALVDGVLDAATLEPLRSMKRLNSLEIRYILLQPDVVDVIAKLPIRESLNLMGTGVPLHASQPCDSTFQDWRSRIAKEDSWG